MEQQDTTANNIKLHNACLRLLAKIKSHNVVIPAVISTDIDKINNLLNTPATPVKTTDEVKTTAGDLS